MEPSTIQISVQQDSVQEPVIRKRVRNWRNKLPQLQTPAATFNNFASVAADNMPELEVKVKTSPKFNDEDQKFLKLDAVTKTINVKQRNETPAKNDQILSKLNIQTSTKLGNMA